MMQIEAMINTRLWVTMMQIEAIIDAVGST
jgi:hypothetical protein